MDTFGGFVVETLATPRQNARRATTVLVPIHRVIFARFDDGHQDQALKQGCRLTA